MELQVIQPFKEPQENYGENIPKTSRTSYGKSWLGFTNDKLYLSDSIVF